MISAHLLVAGVKDQVNVYCVPITEWITVVKYVYLHVNSIPNFTKWQDQKSYVDTVTMSVPIPVQDL